MEIASRVKATEVRLKVVVVPARMVATAADAALGRGGSTVGTRNLVVRSVVVVTTGDVVLVLGKVARFRRQRGFASCRRMDEGGSGLGAREFAQEKSAGPLRTCSPAVLRPPRAEAPRYCQFRQSETPSVLAADAMRQERRLVPSESGSEGPRTGCATGSRIRSSTQSWSRIPTRASPARRGSAAAMVPAAGAFRRPQSAVGTGFTALRRDYEPWFDPAVSVQGTVPERLR